MSYAIAIASAAEVKSEPILRLVDGGLLEAGAQRKRPSRRFATRAEAEAAQAARATAVPSLGSTLLVVAFAAAIACAFAFASSAASARISAGIAQSLDSLPRREVIVHQGDTLWEIADAQGIEGVSTADVVSCIKAENGIGASPIMPGQRLQVPVRE